MLYLCPICEGKGWLMEKDGDGYEGEVTCWRCEGEGKVYDKEEEHERDIKGG
jgi:DnaJ-class molecular chaperone